MMVMVILNILKIYALEVEVRSRSKYWYLSLISIFLSFDPYDQKIDTQLVLAAAFQATPTDKLRMLFYSVSAYRWL